MYKFTLNFTAPVEVIKLLDKTASTIPRSRFSIKLLRLFFQKNPPLRDMRCFKDNDTRSSTLRIPEDLMTQIEIFADKMGYSRQTAIIVAMVASLASDYNLKLPVVAQLEKPHPEQP